MTTIDTEKDSELEHSLHDTSLESLCKSDRMADPILADELEEEHQRNAIVEKESDGTMTCAMLNSAVGDGSL